MLGVSLILTFIIPSYIYSGFFIAILLLYLVSSSRAIDLKTARVLKPICWMAMLGVAYSFNNEFSDITRDIWHITKALSCILLGYFLARDVHNVSRLLKQFINISLVISLLYISTSLFGFRQIGLEHSANELRIAIVAALALPLLMIRNNGLVRFGSVYLRFTAVFIILLAFSLSLSRTALGCVAIIMLAAVGGFDNGKRLILYVVFLSLLAFITIQLIPVIDAGDITFTSKIRNSLAEIAFTDDSDPTAMLINWRGFEAYRAFIGFINATPMQQLIGSGFGATVDLGISVQMSEEMNYQFIPILHNGYLHTLTKYGLLGLILYLLFLLRIIGASFDASSIIGQATIRRILIGLGIILAYATLVITGIYNKEILDSTMIMLGAFLGISENLRRRIRIKSTLTN
jgi:hypothetical protein